MNNEIKLTFKSISENIALARILAASFAARFDLTVSEIDEIKVAVSEAVSNALIHGYQMADDQVIELILHQDQDRLEFIIRDTGCGMDELARRQEIQSGDGERMGLGFSFMESFMDELVVDSKPGIGTTVTMVKYILPMKLQ